MDWAMEAQPSLAAAAPGTGLVFANSTSNADLWSLPIDANRGKPTGQIERLTQDAARDVAPDISPDGRKLAFASSRSGPGIRSEDIWMKDLASGRETALTVTPARDWLPVFSPDGSKVAYTVGQRPKKTGGIRDTFWRRSGGKTVRRLRHRSTTGRGTGNGSSSDPEGQPRRLRLLSATSGQTRDFLQHPGYSFYGPRLSPDNRWLATCARIGAVKWRLLIMPFRADGPAPGERDWVAVADENIQDMACRWSPDGSVIYFVSGQDGSTCIWAQRLDPATKRPAGAPWPVHHAHSVRLSLLGLLNSLTIALHSGAPGDRMVFPMGETTGNIYFFTSSVTLIRLNSTSP